MPGNGHENGKDLARDDSNKHSVSSMDEAGVKEDKQLPKALAPDTVEKQPVQKLMNWGINMQVNKVLSMINCYPSISV